MNKNNIILIIITAVVTCLLTFGVTSFVYSNNKKTNNQDTAKPGEVKNITKYDGEKPNINIRITGLYTKNLTTEELTSKEIPIYNFNATATYHWGMINRDYVGVKLLETLEKLGITNYNSIEFRSDDHLIVEFKKNEITDKAYLTFNTPDKNTGYDTVIYSDFYYLYNYAVEGLSEIVIK